MRSFKKIRNVLVILLIIIAIVYIQFGKSNDIYTSKSYKLYRGMDAMHHSENRKIAMEIKYYSDELTFKMLLATDEEEKQEIEYKTVYYKNLDYEGEQSTLLISGSQGRKSYAIFPKEKSYKLIYENALEKTETYDEWIFRYIYQLENASYYTKGFEIINGKLLYFENFVDTGIKFYFNGEELVYMKSAKLDKCFDNVNNAIYEIKFYYDDTYKQKLKVLSDYNAYSN